METNLSAGLLIRNFQSIYYQLLESSKGNPAVDDLIVQVQKLKVVLTKSKLQLQK